MNAAWNDELLPDCQIARLLHQNNSNIFLWVHQPEHMLFNAIAIIPLVVDSPQLDDD